MKGKPDFRKYRPVKILVEIELLRDIDGCILDGLGGYSNRHEFANEALRSHLFDLEYPDDGVTSQAMLAKSRVEYSAEPTAERGRPPLIPVEEHRSGSQPIQEQENETAANTESVDLVERSPGDFALESIHRGFEATNDAGIISDQPLLGLHNRDWPSIWCLRILAGMASDGYVDVSEFMERATAEAWRTASALLGWEKANGQKVTALLPKNKEKQQASEGAFRSFAIGTIGRRPSEGGKFKVQGPLFQWKTCGLMVEDNQLRIGVTGPGWSLLEKMRGLTPGQPHSPEYADNFFSFLGSSCEEDYWGFLHLVGAIAGGVSRVELVQRFQSQRDWTNSVAATIAQGYLSRAREWGLVEEKIRSGLYRLTGFGREFSSRIAESASPDSPSGNSEARESVTPRHDPEGEKL